MLSVHLLHFITAVANWLYRERCPLTGRASGTTLNYSPCLMIIASDFCCTFVLCLFTSNSTRTLPLKWASCVRQIQNKEMNKYVVLDFSLRTLQKEDVPMHPMWLYQVLTLDSYCLKLNVTSSVTFCITVTAVSLPETNWCNVPCTMISTIHAQGEVK